ncbi:MAG: hypothetical protein RSC93_00130 [Erysipelotrichaceae bacterium]
MNDRFIVDTFREYVGLKLHFTKDKMIYRSPSQFTKLTVDTILARKDISFITRLAYKFDGKPVERKEYLISCFKHNKNAWVGGLLDSECENAHLDRMVVVNSIDHFIISDIKKIIDYMNEHDLNLKDLLKCELDRPLITQIDGIHDETIAIIDKFVPFLQQESYNPYWNERRFMLRKYHEFLSIKANTYQFIEDNLLVL